MDFPERLSLIESEGDDNPCAPDELRDHADRFSTRRPAGVTVMPPWGNVHAGVKYIRFIIDQHLGGTPMYVSNIYKYYVAYKLTADEQ